MKALNLIKITLVAVIAFVANVTVFLPIRITI